MNQTIKQSQAILHSLRLRTSLGTSEMYQIIGRKELVRAQRFTVIPRGSNTFEIFERSTGTTKGELFGHDNACQFARKLEDNAEFFAATRKTAKALARTLLRWTAGLALMLFLFAYFGAGH